MTAKRLTTCSMRTGRAAAAVMTLAYLAHVPGALGGASLEPGLAAYARSDYRTALALLTPEADAGEPAAQLVLGKMYASGAGLLQDYIQAHKWLNLAAAGGAREAAETRDRIAARMTADQVAQAQALARGWRPTAAPAAPAPVQSGPATGLPAGSLAMRVQRMLADLGYDPGPADGVPGTKTRVAVRRYQAHSGLPVDGEITGSLHDALAADLGYVSQAPQPSPAAAPAPAAPAPTAPTGGPPDPGGPGATGAALAEAMSRLGSLVEDAERRRSADPRFIDALRGLLRDYDPARVRKIVSERFVDGEFGNDPRWEILAGRFWVDNRNRLRSDVELPAEQEPRSREELPLAILGAILDQATRTGEPGNERGSTAPYASIELPVRIPTRFSLRAGVAAGRRGDVESPGRLGLALIEAGANRDAGYEIVYDAGPNPRVELARRSPTRRVVLQSASLPPGSGRQGLEIEWSRDERGRMAVHVGGTPILDAWTARQGAALDFAAFRMTNHGGSFGLENLEITGDPP